MRVLSIDTASPLPALALVEAGDDARGREALRPLPKGAAEALPSALQALLAGAALPLRAVERVAVLSGPGSFTGLRAGAAFARGLARALDVPLVAVPTFRAASEAVPGGDADFLLDGGRGEVFRARRRGPELKDDPAPLPREAALAEAGGRRLVELTAEGPVLAPALALLAARETPSPFAPAYGRRSAAEEKARAREVTP